MANRRILAKKILWNYIKNQRLGGYEFIQMDYPGPSDTEHFYCREAKFLVRVGYPELEKEKFWQTQMIRRHQLTEKGIVVYSFHPEHVICHIDKVLSKILSTLHERAKHWRETVVMLN